MPHSPGTPLPGLAGRLVHAIRAWYRRTARYPDHLDAEIAAHLDALAEAHRRRGLSDEDARLAARRDFGGVVQVKERYRDELGWRWLDQSWQDLTYVARSLWRSPGFTLVAVLTLALGVGATTAIFSVVHAALLRPLPYDEGNRLVRLRAVIEGPDGEPRRIPVNLNADERQALATRSRALDHVASSTLWVMNWRGHEPRWQGARVSASVFAMLGVEPLLGRVFNAGDEGPGANAIVLSERAWRRDFGARPDVVGQTVTLEAVLGPPDRNVYTVVGVMPAIFEYPSSRALFWIPFASAAATGPFAPGARGTPPPRLPVVGRLADGISSDAAVADVSPILRQIARDGTDAAGTPPNRPRVLSYEVVQEHAERVRLIRPALMAMSGAVLFVLLIACVNVASLMLARAASRQRETAIRTAVGASRLRLVRLAIVESLLLAALSGMVGLVIAAGSIRFLQALVGGPYRFDIDIDGRNTYPGLETLTLDMSVFWIAVAIATVAGVMLAVAPMLHYLRTTPGEGLRNGSGATGRADISRPFNVRNLLVIVEVAAAMVLLVGGALLTTSFLRMVRADPGYDPAGVLTFQVSLPADLYTVTGVRSFAESLTGHLRNLPGVHAAAYANQLPMVSLRDTAGGLWRTSDPTRRGGPPDAPDARIVSHEFLETMGVRVVAGRGLSAADDENAPHVLLVNEALARRDFGGRDAIGQSIFVGNDPEPWQVVGITADVRQFWLTSDAEPQFFIDARQWRGRGPLFPVGAYYALRVTGDPTALALTVAQVVKQMEPQGVVFHVAAMDELVSATVGRPRLYAVLLGAFAMLGLMLAVIGIYGVIAYGVAQRTREIGVRMALGARRAAVLHLVLRQSLALTLLGVALGLAGATLVTRYLETLLFNVTPLDLSTFVGMASLFVIVATAAALVPARHATRIDPLVALRTE